MEQWEKNFYISAIAGSTNGTSLVVMSKGEVVMDERTCPLTLHRPEMHFQTFPTSPLRKV